MTMVPVNAAIMTDSDGNIVNSPMAPPTPLEIIARAASDPNTDPQKLALLWELWERTKKADAEKAFNQAMSAAQEEMRPILRDAKNPNTSSRFARLESIDNVVRPIYTKHGFSLSFNSGEPRSATGVRILCDVRHSDGFVKAYELEGELDNIGAKGAPTKTAIHGLGSSVSYLRRYLTCMIFNITLTNEDDDGNAAGGQTQQHGGWQGNHPPEHGGWEGSGSQNQADEVAHRKIAELEVRQQDLKAGRKSSIPEPPVEEGLKASVKSKNYKMLKEFRELHKQYKDLDKESAYYGILGEYGVCKSNDFPDDAAGIKLARQCYKAMGKDLGALREQVATIARIPDDRRFQGEWPDNPPEDGQPFLYNGTVYQFHEASGNWREVK